MKRDIEANAPGTADPFITGWPTEGAKRLAQRIVATYRAPLPSRETLDNVIAKSFEGTAVPVIDRAVYASLFSGAILEVLRGG